MKSLISISFLILSALSMSSATAKTIFANESSITLDLSGTDGRDGRRGSNCESGDDGEDGYSGENAIVYFSNILNLKNIELDMSGGQGGEGGQRGSSYNCDSDTRYSRGRDGYTGQHGYIYIVEKDTLLAKEKSSNQIDFSTSHGSELKFSSYSWKQMEGAKKLFNSDSRIRDGYFAFDKTINSKLKLELSSSVQDRDLDHLSLSVKYDVKYIKTPKLTLFENDKKVKALIDYKFTNSNDSKSVLIKNIYFKEDISDTSFVGSNNSGLETSLSMKDPSFMDTKFKNSFSFTIYKYHPFIEHYVIVGSISSKYLDVVQENDMITVNIGKASVFKNQFVPGSTYKVIIGTRKSIGENGLEYNLKKYFTIPKK